MFSISVIRKCALACVASIGLGLSGCASMVPNSLKSTDEHLQFEKTDCPYLVIHTSDYYGGKTSKVDVTKAKSVKFLGWETKSYIDIATTDSEHTNPVITCEDIWGTCNSLQFTAQIIELEINDRIAKCR